MREMGPEGCAAGVDIEIMSAQNEKRFAEMELGAKEASARVVSLEEQAASLRKEGADARNAYQQQRAFIQAQLGEGADPAKMQDFLQGMVASMDVQFGIVPGGEAQGPTGFSPASSVCRSGGRSRQEGRRAGGPEDGEMRRERSPRSGGGRDSK